MHAGCKSYISYNFNFKDAKKKKKKKSATKLIIMSAYICSISTKGHW